MSSDVANQAQPTFVSRFKRWWLSGLLLVAAVVLGLLNVNAWVERRELPKGADAPQTPSVAGSSEQLHDTVFVPTLERPLPKGKSVIWCATVSLAWQELEKISPRPLEVQGAEQVCRELRFQRDVGLEPTDYYAAGGFVGDGVVERIRGDLAQRFPNATLPALPDSAQGVGFAWLDVALKFDYSFRQTVEPLRFKDSNGRETAVHAFGVREEDKGQRTPFREQVLVLFRDKGEYAVDLSAKTKPYQIILARLTPGRSLLETVDILHARIAKGHRAHLNDVAVLSVPSMNWQLDHRFRELEKRLIGYPDNKIVLMHQSVQFKLDRQGAFVRSSALIPHDWSDGDPENPPPDYYPFDRPFLIVMKNRASLQPFFVMWVDNAELLQHL